MLKEELAEDIGNEAFLLIEKLYLLICFVSILRFPAIPESFYMFEEARFAAGRAQNDGFCVSKDL